MKYWDVARRLPPQTVARLVVAKVARETRHAWGRWRAKTFGTRISDEAFRAVLTSDFRDEKAVADWMRSGRGSRFFIHHSHRDQLVSTLRKHFPELEKTTIAAADRACDHVFDLLGSGPVHLGERIDWHVDFKTNHHYDSQAYFADIHPAAYPGGHDIKVPWELSRFQYVAWLGQAYWFAGDEKYACEFVAQVSDWIERNPPELGVNWTTSMEAAIRVVNWFWGLAFFRASPALTDEFLVDLAKSLLAHGRHIIHNLERHDTFTGNHYLADLVGLVYIGTLCPYFKEAVSWRKFGMVELWKEMEKQVYPDGVDFEASIGYHCFVTEFFLSVVTLCDLYQLPVPEQVRERLEKMLEFVLYYTKPDGTVPLFGDFDNGRLHRLKVWIDDEREWLDHRYLLAIGAVMYGRDDFGQGAGDQWEEAVWLLGDRAITVKEVLESKSLQPLNLQSRSFPASGLYIMRDRDLFLAVDAGPGGQNGKGGHAHNDTLSFELFANGQSWIVDPGTYVYTSDFESRNRFRSARYHNSLLVDGRESNRMDNTALFSLPDRAIPEIDRWHATSDYDFLSAGYASACEAGPSALIKRVFCLDKRLGLLFIRDEIISAGRHTIDAFLHFVPIGTRLAEDIVYLERPSSKQGLAIRILSNALGQKLSEGEGWVSHCYGVRARAPVFHFGGEFEDRLIVCWLMAPMVAGNMGLPIFDMSFSQLTEWFQRLTPNGLRG